MDDRRRFVALLSCLVSQSLLFLPLFPSSTPLSLSFDSNSNFNGKLFVLLHEFLSSQGIAASLGLQSVSRKRKRTHFPEPESDPTHEDGSPELGDRGTVLGSSRTIDSFRTFFKMKSQTFEWLLGLLEPLLECRDPIGSPINLSAELRLGIGLYRLASGSDYSEIANRFGVTEPVARFCAKQLCRVLCTNFRFWVAFPSPDELRSVSNSFEELTGFPNCCGVINCARFKVTKHHANKVFDEMSNMESIAVQIVVDSSSKILSIVAGFRGDKSDSTVLKLSTLYKDIEEGKLLNSNYVNVNGIAINQYLIGYRSYPLLPWLMVPFPGAVAGSCEDEFNKEISLMRTPGLKAIASLKNWGVLSRPIKEEFKTAVGFIGACSILHNVLLMREDDSAFCEDLDYYTSNYQNSEYCGDISLREISIEEKASVIRNTLAANAREFCN